MAAPQTIPDGHYIDQMRRLTAYLIASQPWTVTQKHKIESEQFEGRLRKIRALGHDRGEQAHEINGACEAFRRVFGKDWTPRTDHPVSRQLLARGVTLRPL